MRTGLFQGSVETVAGFKTMNLAVELRACLPESPHTDHHLSSPAAGLPLLVGFFDGIAAVCAKREGRGSPNSLGKPRPRQVGETGFEPATPWSRIGFGRLGWGGTGWYRGASARHRWDRRASRSIEWNR